MRVAVELDVPAAVAVVWPHLESLDCYPPWMRLVHRVEPSTPVGGHPAWWVELRARVGPLARSKRLLMARTACEPQRLARFERAEHDGKDHAEWTLSAELEGDEASSIVRAELYYGGQLWSGGILERVLEDEIRRAKLALVELVSAAPPAPPAL